MSHMCNGLSVGIMFGIFSGALYLVGHTFHYVRKARRSRSSKGGGGGDKTGYSEVCPCDEVQKERMRGSAGVLRCALCGTGVCRSCSKVVRPSAKIRLCGTCSQHREIQCPSGEWIYRELKTKFHDVTPSSSTDSSLDVNMEVREFIERLTENLVSGSVDDVTVEPLSSHSEYKSLCSQFHPHVQEILSRLSRSLQIAISEFPPGQQSGDSPSEIHVQLKRLVSELRTQAMQLPLLEMDSGANGSEDSLVTNTNQHFSLRTYEDLLATAIINKVVETAQIVLMEEHLRTPVTVHPPDGGTFISCIQIGVDDHDTPKDKIIEESQEQENNNITINKGSEMCRISEEELESWSGVDGEEEETSQEEEKQPEKRQKTRRNRRSRSHVTRQDNIQNFLQDLKYSHRVPFPELGADVIEGSVQESLLEETARTTLYLVNSDSHHSLNSESWEENWLFQRRRLRIASANPNRAKKQEDTRVPMLVPNPRAEHSNVRARVGDMDADQLSSDLSDYESYMSNKEAATWSGEEGLEEDSLKSEGAESLTRLLGAPDLIEATNQELHGATLILAHNNGMTEGSEFDQQEGEYLEDYASIGQRSLTSLQEVLRSDSPLPETNHVPDILESNQIRVQQESIPNRTVQEFSVFHSKIEEQSDDSNYQRLQESSQQGQHSSTYIEDIIPPLPLSEPPQKKMLTDEIITPPIAAPRRLQIAPLPDVDELATPPRPGTIAEREHLKWLQAKPMPNNPYTEENIARRLGRRHTLPIPATNSNPPNAVTTPPPHRPLKINCSGQKVNVTKYARDYYINELPSAKMENESPQLGAEDLGVDDMLSDAGSTEVSGSVEVTESLTGSSASLYEHQEEPVQMPSVRALAKNFGVTLSESGEELPSHLRKKVKNDKSSGRKTASEYNKEKKIILVETTPKQPAPAPVHSLTARNPQPTERNRVNLEFWKNLEPTPTPAPRNK